jgi:flagellar FliL protein
MSAAAAAAGGAEAGAGGKGGGKRKLLLLAVPLVLVIGGAGAFFTGLLDPLVGGHHKAPEAPAHEAEPAHQEPPSFLDLPELITNLATTSKRPSYVKLRAKLELARASDAPAVQAAMPRVVDLLQTYMREMRPEELRGSAGTYRLREELLARIAPAVAPVQVRDILFIELLVQ